MLQSMVIGLGQIGLMYDYDMKRFRPSSHTLAYQNHTEINLIAASDLSIARKLDLNKIAPNTRFYLDYKQMLLEHKADVISLCTPPGNHLEIIQDIVSLTQTRLIFCEKPIIQNKDEAQRLLSLLAEAQCVLIPNLSRRWSSGIQRVHQSIEAKVMGALQTINVRYTRGIHNTGSHIFDLIQWFAGAMNKVFVINQVPTSADEENDPSFSFHFITDRLVTGFAEAFNDRQYYMFEIDLFFETGKIEISESGNKIHYFYLDAHPLFSGFSSLHSAHKEDNLLQESTMLNAVYHLVDVLNNKVKPICTVRDGLYPIYVAQAILRASQTQAWEEVSFNDHQIGDDII